MGKIICILFVALAFAIGLAVNPLVEYFFHGSPVLVVERPVRVVQQQVKDRVEVMAEELRKQNSYVVIEFASSTYSPDEVRLYMSNESRSFSKKFKSISELYFWIKGNGPVISSHD